MSKRMRDEEVIVVNDKKDIVKRSPVEVPNEYWATNSPYIDAYIKALNYANYDPIETEFTSTDSGDRNEIHSDRPERPSEASKNGKKSKKKKAPKFYKKRKFPLIMLTILMVAMVAVAALGIVGPISKYTAAFVFNKDDGTKAGISMFDPVYSLIQSVFSSGEEEEVAAAEDTETDEDAATIEFSKYYKESILDEWKDFESEGAKTEDVVKRLIHYAFPIIILLFLISCVYLLIKSLIVLCSKKTKKYKLGYAWFVNFLFLLGVIIGGMVWNGFGVGELEQYFVSAFVLMGVGGDEMLSASTVGMGLGLYIEIALAVVSLIVIMFSYKKLKPGQVKAVSKKTKKA